MFDLTSSGLGKKSQYVSKYKPDLLFTIPRKLKRAELFVSQNLVRFHGVDIWNAYEVSWLDIQGKPQVKIAEIIYDANSEFMVESKSLKLYLNSFNNSNFNTPEEVRNLITSDLSKILKTRIKCVLYDVESNHYIPQKIQGILLDDLDINIQNCKDKPILEQGHDTVEETLYTHLLKSNCLVTGQPDFGSLIIRYSGQKINHISILQYIISLRDLNEFHEQCVERIFFEIYNNCHHTFLEASARYTRRGGIDINPIRSSSENFTQSNYRSLRQ
ncbi:MAG: NADPH-dependent 7-cyano-7-deazaguanine reductase QueF [Candidatus Midichloria sp.]|nr:NADPH-dependent 7-cyano-7-deazaguanine reductase QueF [Candidatus Midichloria sp.]